MEMTYEIRFGIYGKRKLQEFRVYPTRANSYAEALRNFVLWANNGEEKFDMKGKPYKFEKYPVTEDDAVSIARLTF